MTRTPWAQKAKRGLAPAREAAIAVEAVLLRYISDEAIIDRILNQVEMGITHQLRGAVGSGTGSGFDPSTGQPSRSRLQYQHRARNADEIKQMMADEQRGQAAVASSGSVSDQNSDQIADPAAALMRPERPQPQVQRAQPQRPSSKEMPWL